MSETNGVRVERRAGVGMILLRGAQDELGRACEEAAGLAAPERRLSTGADGRRLLWMSPDELLLVCDADEVSDLSDRLRDALGRADDPFFTVADVSDARAVFDLDGPGVEHVIASAMPVDFARLAPVEVRRSRLAQVPAAIWREGGGIRLVCFRSVADYVEALLRNAAANRAEA